MVDPRFGDDEAGLARANRARYDRDAPVVWHQVLTLALFSLRCSRPEITEQTELTAKHGETKKRRPKDAVRRAGLRSRPADTAESDRKRERLRCRWRFVFSIRSGSARRFATPVEPVCLCASPLLCASVFGRCLHILRVLARWLGHSENRSRAPTGAPSR